LSNSREVFQFIDKSFDGHRKIRHAGCVAHPRASRKPATIAVDWDPVRRGSRAFASSLASNYEPTTRLFLTENTFGTPFARMPARFLSPSLSTTPSSVILPFLTIMWIDGTAWNP